VTADAPAAGGARAMSSSSKASRSDSNGSVEKVVVTSDRTRRLSEGTLVQASVRARLLGLPVLRLDATVVLAPAEISAPRSAALEPERRKSARSSAALTTDAGGHGLAEAVRSINEGAQLLAEVRSVGA
jgi:hypothetical protein